MEWGVLLVAGLFLPLFPQSMLFNALFARVQQPLLRAFLVLAWPQVGIVLVVAFIEELPGWLPYWGAATALMYALRALALRDIGLWAAFIATSAWSLLWISVGQGTDTRYLTLFALGMSLPLILLIFLCHWLERRFGAAYLGLYGGLAQTAPRFSGILVMVVLGILATPVFPSFFALLSMIIESMQMNLFLAVAVGTVWLLWSWAGANLLQGLVAGPKQESVGDLGCGLMWLNIAVLSGLAVTGVYCLGAVV